MLLIPIALPLGVIEVFTPVHMFYKSAVGEHLLSVPFFLIMPGRVIEHIAIDQYSPSHTHTPNRTLRLKQCGCHTFPQLCMGGCT